MKFPRSLPMYWQRLQKVQFREVLKGVKAVFMNTNAVHFNFFCAVKGFFSICFYILPIFGPFLKFPTSEAIDDHEN